MQLVTTRTKTTLTALVSAVTIAAVPVAPAVAGQHSNSVRAASAPAYSAARAYRRGVVPLRGLEPIAAANTRGTVADSPDDLNYGGGIDGVGVTTGPPRVYLVFWGSQWGTQSSAPNGDATFSGDPQGMAPDLQAFFDGLGTGGETWSGVMTQYCQGVGPGTQTCPSSSTHVGYPTGGALAGVWSDESVASPAGASAHQ